MKIYRKINQLIFTFITRIMAKESGQHLTVNGLSIVTKNTLLGNNVNFNGMHISGLGNVIIGDNFHSGPKCRVITHIHDYNGNKIPYDETVICKNVEIKDNVWLGESVMILGGVVVGEGAIVQAGSVVVGDIPDFAIAGGHPARVFSQRNKEKYLRLKSEGAFL